MDPMNSKLHCLGQFVIFPVPVFLVCANFSVDDSSARRISILPSSYSLLLIYIIISWELSRQPSIHPFITLVLFYSFCAEGHRKQKNKKVSVFSFLFSSLIFELIPHWLAQICSGRSGSFSTPTEHCTLLTVHMCWSNQG